MKITVQIRKGDDTYIAARSYSEQGLYLLVDKNGQSLKPMQNMFINHDGIRGYYSGEANVDEQKAKASFEKVQKNIGNWRKFTNNQVFVNEL